MRRGGSSSPGVVQALKGLPVSVSHSLQYKMTLNPTVLFKSVIL